VLLAMVTFVAWWLGRLANRSVRRFRRHPEDAEESSTRRSREVTARTPTETLHQFGYARNSCATWALLELRHLVFDHLDSHRRGDALRMGLTAVDRW
jgi:hypothetical protein